jgi:hypothetical protein
MRSSFGHSLIYQNIAAINVNIFRVSKSAIITPVFWYLSFYYQLSYDLINHSNHDSLYISQHVISQIVYFSMLSILITI